MRARSGWTDLMVAGAIAGMCLIASGCGHRKHLTRTHGKSTEELMKAQIINPDAGNKSQPDLGLDSQEAAIVAESYHKALGPKAGAAARSQSQILLLQPDEPQRGGRR